MKKLPDLINYEKTPSIGIIDTLIFLSSQNRFQMFRLCFLFCLLVLFYSHPLFLMAQEVVELPINFEDESIIYSNTEKEYFSNIWNNQVVTNVSKPTLTVYKPAPGTANGTSVIICPGGGLYALSITSEGREVAEWLSERGVTAFVLKYRLVPTGEDGTSEIMNDGDQVLVKAGKVLPLATEDALNSIAHVRSNADQYGVDRNKIGLIGFSAGGAVTMAVAYGYAQNNRPDFIGPIYAWMNVVPPHPVPDDAPPMFALCATDDPLGLAPASVQIYSDWITAGVPAELHMYSKGGHGFGMKKQDLPSDHWISRFGDWMEAHDLIPISTP